MNDPVTFALDLARVIRMLQAVPTTDARRRRTGPAPLAEYYEPAIKMILVRVT